MDPNLFPTSSLYFMIMLFTLIHLPTSLSQVHEQYTNCGQLFQCGEISNIGYPFWGETRHSYCGRPEFELRCEEDAPWLTIRSRTYRILSYSNTPRTLTVAREEFYNTSCPRFLYNTTLDPLAFSYGSNTRDINLYYGCTRTIPGPQIPIEFECTINTTTSLSYYTTSDLTSPPAGIELGSCNHSVIVRVFQSVAVALTLTPPSITISAALAQGFALDWTADDAYCDDCVQSGGRCGYEVNLRSFTCYCPDQPYPFTCGNGNGNGNRTGNGRTGSRENVSLPIGIAIGGAAFFGLGLGWFVFSYRQRKKRLAAQAAQSVEAPETESKDLVSPFSSKGLTLTTTPSTNFSRSIPSFPSSTFAHEKGSTYFGVQVFSYAELEEATDNFARKLGDGGFGTVCYGKLHDGRVIAVKRLYENNFRRVEQFINEVEILTRLRHEHLVTLYGCTSKQSRELLLVYEYIPNGTIADHLHGRRANSGLLSWPVRLNIAIETADALAYLHASEIIHRDVKTNNVLLDNDFRVKVADFGLSRLFPLDVTHVSTAPQGTPGYVDPEYYQCYQLTTKSDVYSFGVVLVELISSKEAVDTNRHRHDINLASMAVNKIQNHTLHELVDPSLGFETNSSVRRMTTLVAELAFRCLQQERDMRPTMEEVLEALKKIKNEEFNTEKAEVVDIVEDDADILKPNSPSMSPKSVVTEKLFSNSTTPNSSENIQDPHRYT